MIRSFSIIPLVCYLLLGLTLVSVTGCRDDDETFQVVVIDSQEELERFILGDESRINGDLLISGNVTSLEILSSVEKIIGNLVIIDSQLTSLDGLDRLELVTGDITILSNPPFQQKITDFCAIRPLLSMGSFRSITILNNLHNPTVSEIQNGLCDF